MQVINADYLGQELTLTAKNFRTMIESAVLTLFRGYVPLSREQLIDLCVLNSPNELLHWSFGPVMDLEVESQPVNYLFSREAVPFHWDGAFHQTPSFLVFNCIEPPPPQSGGETTFVDTQKIMQEATSDELRYWSHAQLTYETEKKAHYGGRFSTSMVQKHPRNGRGILRYAEPVDTKLNPVSLRIEGESLQATQRLVQQMREKLYHPKNLHVHRWQKGDLLIADNYALLHGRYAIETNAPRHIRRVQIL